MTGFGGWCGILTKQADDLGEFSLCKLWMLGSGERTTVSECFDDRSIGLK